MLDEDLALQVGDDDLVAVGGDEDLLDQPSQLLSTDSDDLLAQLQGGSDLRQMLQGRGITQTAAAATVGEGF